MSTTRSRSSAPADAVKGDREPPLDPVVGDVIRVRGHDWLVDRVGDGRLSLRLAHDEGAPVSMPAPLPEWVLGARGEHDAESSSQQERDGADYGLGDSAGNGREA
jgi:hypothetical protein